MNQQYAHLEGKWVEVGKLFDVNIIQHTHTPPWRAKKTAGRKKKVEKKKLKKKREKKKRGKKQIHTIRVRVVKSSSKSAGGSSTHTARPCQACFGTVQKDGCILFRVIRLTPLGGFLYFSRSLFLVQARKKHARRKKKKKKTTTWDNQPTACYFYYYRPSAFPSSYIVFTANINLGTQQHTRWRQGLIQHYIFTWYRTRGDEARLGTIRVGVTG